MKKKIILIKIGTSVLLNEHHKLDESYMKGIAKQVHSLKEKGFGVVLVVSGAVASGASYFDVINSDSLQQQAAAGVGQPILISKIKEIFEQNALNIAQLLLTKNQLNSKSSTSIKRLIECYIQANIVTVINENDTVGLHAFGCNDILAAHISNLLKVDHFIILSSIQGSRYGRGGAINKQKAIELVRKEKIKTCIVDGKIENIILNTMP